MVSTATSVDSVKKIFNDKVKEPNDAISHSSLFLDNEGYNNISQEVKEAQISRKNNQPLTSKHYWRLKRYDVMKMGDTQKLTESGSVLETAHVNIGHKRTRSKRYWFVCDSQKHFSLPF